MKLARLLTLLFVTAAPMVAAQQSAPIPTRTAPDYLIGPMDSVSVTVNSPVAQPEYSAKPYVVQSDGTIQLPSLQKPVKIGGLTVSGANAAIRQALIDGMQFEDPIVSVTVTDYRNSSVTVQGAVRNPGNISLRADRMTISDAIATAGGFQPGAGSRIWLRGGANRPKPDIAGGAQVEDGAEVFRKDDVLQGRVYDARVYDGDTISVEMAPHFYVTGYVKNSTAEYNWEPGTTLQKAIAMAGGVNPEGAANRISISRKDPKTGKFENAKMSKDKMSTLIEPDDVINVPKKRM